MKKIFFTLVFLATFIAPANAEDVNTYGEPVQDETYVVPVPPPVDNAKLDQILEGQALILKNLEEIKQEIQIVKIRATEN